MTLPAPATGVGTLNQIGDARLLRIGIVTEFYYPHLGGICEHVHFLARELRLLGHDVDIITSHIGPAPEKEGLIRLGKSLPVYFNGSQARVTLGITRRQLRDLFRERRYDLIHVHSPLAPILPILAVEAAEVPVVGTVHTNHGRLLMYSLFHRRVQRVADRLDARIAVSEAAARAVREPFGGDWQIIPNGVDLDFFRPDVPAPPVYAGGRPSILFLGRLDPRNGLASLIHAFGRVREDIPDAQLVVVGDGPLRSHYRRLADGDPAIRFEGSAQDLRPGYYANATVYACPTTKASFGITLLEAMACRTPIVCSSIEGFTEVVHAGVDALMVPMNDDDRLADALTRVIRDRGYAERLADAGYREVQRYAWPEVTRQILQVYASVVPSRATPVVVGR